jgi:alanine-glyoxylate transaminase / serine-glyoxylate transaminase / serine-pyruvate transaminase
MQPPAPLSVPKRRLMGPGPSDAHPRVLEAMSRPLVGHLDPAFVVIMDEIKTMLRALFCTENEMTFVVSGPGSAGMEACLVNLLEPGDDAVICVNGVFGGRMADIAERCGANVTRVEAEWGHPIDPDAVRQALNGRDVKLVAAVHAETSTGARSPIAEISRVAHEAGALFVADTVTSFCGIDLRVDEWQIDAVYSGSQKCLSAPPGLSPVSFSSRALDAIAKRKTKVQSWFLDVGLLRAYWEGSKRSYHHTAPVSACYALREALCLVLEEGLEARIARHLRNHHILREGLETLGFEFVVAPEWRLPQLNAVRFPAGIDDASARRRLLDEFGIEIGAGLGAFAGKVWRIGLMGESSTVEHVAALLAALERMEARG